MVLDPKRLGPLVLRLLTVIGLLGWPKGGSAAGMWSVVAPGGTALGQVGYVRALAVDTAGNLYILDADSSGNDRIQKQDVRGSWSVIHSYTSGTSALAVDIAGNLYVADGGVQKRDAQGNWSVLADQGPAPGQVSYAYDLAVDAAGNFYVADFVHVAGIGGDYDRIQKRATQGNWSVIANPAPQGQQIMDLVADPTGDLYISVGLCIDACFDIVIQKWDAHGSWSGTIGNDSDNGLLLLQAVLAVDTVGDLYVADYTDNGRIQKRDAHGSWSVLATGGTALGQVSRPTALAVDAAGHVYVADQAGGYGRVQEYTPLP